MSDALVWAVVALMIGGNTLGLWLVTVQLGQMAQRIDRAEEVRR